MQSADKRQVANGVGIRFLRRRQRWLDWGREGGRVERAVSPSFPPEISEIRGSLGVKRFIYRPRPRRRRSDEMTDSNENPCGSRRARSGRRGVVWVGVQNDFARQGKKVLDV